MELFLALALWLGSVNGFAQISGPAPIPLPSPSSTVSSPSPSPAPSIDPLVGKKLLSEFARALKAELKSLDHRHKFELKDLKASQSVRQKEWERKEREARHAYFAEHPKGPDRRAYVQDFLGRRKMFLQLLSDEKADRVRAQEVRRQALVEDQANRFKEFKDLIDRGQEPPSRLWPQAGG